VGARSDGEDLKAWAGVTIRGVVDWWQYPVDDAISGGGAVQPAPDVVLLLVEVQLVTTAEIP
jgi:hypothetical protein